MGKLSLGLVERSVGTQLKMGLDAQQLLRWVAGATTRGGKFGDGACSAQHCSRNRSPTLTRSQQLETSALHDHLTLPVLYTASTAASPVPRLAPPAPPLYA